MRGKFFVVLLVQFMVSAVFAAQAQPENLADYMSERFNAMEEVNSVEIIDDLTLKLTLSSGKQAQANLDNLIVNLNEAQTQRERDDIINTYLEAMRESTLTSSKLSPAAFRQSILPVIRNGAHFNSTLIHSISTIHDEREPVPTPH